MIEFLKLRACLVRINGRHASNMACAAIATRSNSTVQWQDREQALALVHGFKQAKRYVRGDTGAGGLVAPLPCTAYFGKLAILFGCSLPRQA